MKSFVIALGALLAVLSLSDANCPVKTVRQCEHKNVNLACPSGQKISIDSARYGRQIGSSHCKSKHMKITTDCGALKSLKVVQDRCNGKASCTVPATNRVFGDPCVGTFKYLEIQYVCKGSGTEGQTGGGDGKEPGTGSCDAKFNGRCYKVGSGLKTFAEAEAACKKDGYSLTNIRRKADNDIVAGLAAKAKARVWIGINDRKKEGSFRWSVFDYDNWNKGEPNNYRNTNEDCTEMYKSNGKWNDNKCSVHRYYICERVKVGGKCPTGFKHVKNDRCYFTGGLKSHHSATADCRGKGGFLAKINNQAENDFVKSIIKGNTWIGYDDIQKEGTFTWKGYQNWNTGEPNNYRNTKEECTEMYKSSGKWNDNKCSAKRYYICERVNGCPSSEKKFGRCYYISKITKNYLDAEADCKNRGGVLANIRNQVENNFVKSKISGSTWIGYKCNSQRLFTWNKFTNWNKNEPNNVGNEDCTEMFNAGAAKGKWNDLPCNHKRQYICKK